MKRSRQNQWQIEHKKRGLCVACSEPSWLGSVYCSKHAAHLSGERLARKAFIWPFIDWSKPDSVIAREVGVEPPAVAYQRSKRNKQKLSLNATKPHLS